MKVQIGDKINIIDKKRCTSVLAFEYLEEILECINDINNSDETVLSCISRFEHSNLSKTIKLPSVDYFYVYKIVDGLHILKMSHFNKNYYTYLNIYNFIKPKNSVFEIDMKYRRNRNINKLLDI